MPRDIAVLDACVLHAAPLQRTRVLMDAAVPDGLVSGHVTHAQNSRLPDPADEHVLAAALYCGAESIVTYNLADFPEEVLGSLGLAAEHPDDFLCGLFRESPIAFVEAVNAQRRALTNPSRSLPELLETLCALHLHRTVAELETVLKR